MLVDEAAHLRVFALGVLADYDEIDLAALLAGERRADARIEVGRADIGVLIERAPDRQQESVQGGVVGNLGMAYRAEQDGIAGLQQVDRPGGHHAAPTEVMVGAPFEILKREGNVVFPADSLEHALALRDDLFADAVSRDHRDRKSLHASI